MQINYFIYLLLFHQVIIWLKCFSLLEFWDMKISISVKLWSYSEGRVLSTIFLAIFKKVFRSSTLPRKTNNWINLSICQVFEIWCCTLMANCQNTPGLMLLVMHPMGKKIWCIISLIMVFGESFKRIIDLILQKDNLQWEMIHFHVQNINNIIINLVQCLGQNTPKFGGTINIQYLQKKLFLQCLFLIN